MNYKRITVKTLSNIAMVLCVIIAIGTFVGTFRNNSINIVSELKSEISELKALVAENEEIIAQANIEITEATEKLPGLKEAEAKAKKALDAANDSLDTVCDRSYYSAYFCIDALVCEPFHTAVSDASSKYSSAKNALTSCENTIYYAERDIEDATERNENLNAEIKRLSSRKAKASWTVFFLIVAMLLALAEFVFIVRFLYDRTNKKNGLMACGMLAGSSFLYLLLPTATTFLTYLSGIIIFALLAGLISEKIQKRLAARVTIIIFSVIILLTTIFFAPVTAICSAIAFILMSLVLVPCVFTEYLDIAKHIFFTIITFGIWYLIWMYNFTENLNKVEEAEKRAPVRELILCALLPLYYIFWTYKTAANTELYAAEKGKSCKIEVLCLALSIISPLLASIIIQDKTNIIVGKPVENNVVEEAAEETVEATVEEAAEETVEATPAE